MNSKSSAISSMHPWTATLRTAGFILILATVCALGRCEEKKPVCVEDAIAMSRLADPSYFRGVASEGRVAHFSPDGSRFFVMVRKGDISSDSNLYSVYLFETAHLFE